MEVQVVPSNYLEFKIWRRTFNTTGYHRTSRVARASKIMNGRIFELELCIMNIVELGRYQT